ncbi:MAG: glycosyltransferase family 87 protein [Anaerolineae bacterium]|nr:glycosyltransferase family 87 protein [Anaerolineae bacterium]
MTSTTESKTSDFSLILILFFTSRLMMLLAFPPENLIVYGDYQTYFNIAAFVSRGYWPYVDFWYEFPPIFPYLNILIYTLAGQQLKNYIVLLAVTLLIVELGNLYLLYRLALALHGPATALQTAWIYAALFIPIFFWLGNFDALTTFFILLGVYALLKNRPVLLALALGLGVMIKIVPAFLIATVWRAKGWRPALIYAGTTLGICLVILGPFFLMNPATTVASLQAQASKSSYETVWALLDGNDTTGNFGPLSDRLEVAKATEPLHNPPRIPNWLRLIPFGLLGLFVLTRPVRRPPPADALIFTSLTFVIFFLWSPGWSPQWQTFLIPLLLLALPQRRAVLFIIVLGFVNFLEWPVMLSRGLNELLPVTILTRTVILILLGVDLYGQLHRQADLNRQPPGRSPAG